MTDFGSSSEICDIAHDLFEDKLAQRLIKKALAAGVHFQPDDIMNISLLMDKPTLSKLVETSAVPLSREQLEDMYMLIDDDVFEKASRRSNVNIFSDEDNEKVEEEIDADDFEPYEEPAPKIGFFTALILGLGLTGENKPHNHNGKCNGDCANCPAHYGYRYGRWYYGHHHNHGCEFGGNGGL